MTRFISVHAQADAASDWHLLNLAQVHTVYEHAADWLSLWTLQERCLGYLRMTKQEFLHEYGSDSRELRILLRELAGHLRS